MQQEHQPTNIIYALFDTLKCVDWWLQSDSIIYSRHECGISEGIYFEFSCVDVFFRLLPFILVACMRASKMLLIFLFAAS